jgi:hypothetical protein
VEKLDSVKLKDLLAEADDRYHINRKSGFDYQGHLDFTANYIANNYHRKKGRRRG